MGEGRPGTFWIHIHSQQWDCDDQDPGCPTVWRTAQPLRNHRAAAAASSAAPVFLDTSPADSTDW